MFDLNDTVIWLLIWITVFVGCLGGLLASCCVCVLVLVGLVVWVDWCWFGLFHGVGCACFCVCCLVFPI